MSYLVLVLGGIIGFLTYYIYKREKYKDCQFCGEPIRKKAILCKHCGRDLLSHPELIAKSIEQIKEDIVNNNFKKISAIFTLSASKKVLETQIFVLQGIRLLTKNKK